MSTIDNVENFNGIAYQNNLETDFLSLNIAYRT